MQADEQGRSFTDISIRFLSGTASESAEPAGISVTARLGSDERGSFVEFHEKKRSETATHHRFRLENCQIVKLGPAIQLWIVNTPSEDQDKAVYSKSFTADLKSEEKSNAFFEAVQNPKKDINLPNGSLESLDSKFDKKIEASSAKMYFHYYGQLLHQQNMLQDYVRTGTYYAAIVENRADFQGRIVVDVGAGSGILSLFAAQAGAKHVYAVEASSMADYAKKLIAGNPNLAQRITVIHGKVEDVELPEKADVLISEPMGTLLVNERMLESYIIARDRFLVPGGKLFPGIGRIHMAPFSDEYLFVEVANKALFWQQQSYYGVDLTPLHAAAFQGYFSQPVVDAFDPRLLVAPPAMHTLDLNKMQEEDLYEIVIPLSFTASVAARIHGLACWFDVFFNGSTVPRWLTTAPGAPTTHWYQLRLVLAQPLYVMAGQSISARVHLSAHSAQSYTINLTMSTASWGAGAGTGAGAAQGTQGTSLMQQTSSGKFDLKEPYYRMSQVPSYSWSQDQQQAQPDGSGGIQQPGSQASPQMIQQNYW